MKSRLLLIPMILATGVAIADHSSAISHRASADGQTQAAALLGGRPNLDASVGPSSLSSTSVVPGSKTTDAQALAAALLSRPRR